MVDEKNILFNIRNQFEETLYLESLRFMVIVFNQDNPYSFVLFEFDPFVT